MNIHILDLPECFLMVFFNLFLDLPVFLVVWKLGLEAGLDSEPQFCQEHVIGEAMYFLTHHIRNTKYQVVPFLVILSSVTWLR